MLYFPGLERRRIKIDVGQKQIFILDVCAYFIYTFLSLQVICLFKKKYNQAEL